MSYFERQPIPDNPPYFSPSKESVENLLLWKSRIPTGLDNPDISLAAHLENKGLPVHIGPHILPDGSSEIWTDGFHPGYLVADIRCGPEALEHITRVSGQDDYRLLTLAYAGDPSSKDDVETLLRALKDVRIKWAPAIAQLYVDGVAINRQFEARRRGVFPVDVNDGIWANAGSLHKEWQQLFVGVDGLRSLRALPEAVFQVVETLVSE